MVIGAARVFKFFVYLLLPYFIFASPPSFSKNPHKDPPKSKHQTSEVEEKNIVIVGSGIAGLTALHRLQENGMDAGVYESLPRNGGRIREDYVKEENTTLNAGAELVDSDNSEFLKLVNEVGLKVIPRFSTSKEAAYFYNIDGRWLSHKKLMEKIFESNTKVIESLFRDQELLEKKDSEALKRLDQMTIYDYLLKLEADPILIQYTQAGTLSELGRDLQELSARVLFDQIEIDLKNKNLEFLPHHDEAWVVEGGTYKVVQNLSEKYKNNITNDHTLVQVTELADGTYNLHFKTSGRKIKIIHAKNVIITIPPHQWDDVVWKVTTPIPLKLESLQYARNSKVVLFFDKVFWERGTVLGLGLTSNNGFQIWDTTIPGSNRTALTIFTESFSDSKNSVEKFVHEALSQLEELYPGIQKSFLKFKIFDWPHSYTSADKVMDKTLLSQTPNTNGRLLFAGEVFGGEFQGYIEGAVRSGQSVAQKILSRSSNACAMLFLP